MATAASEAAPSSSSDDDDFSWRLLEGANIHARREHARVALWPSTGDRARPPPPKRSFLDIDEVETFARDNGIKKNTLRLCYRELFRRGKSTFEHTPDVSARDMKLLKENFTVCTSEVVETKTTEDGSGAKMVVKLHDGKLIETVVIGHSRSKDGDEGAQAASDGGDVEKEGKVFRNTVCVSSQVGCAMGCTFCETGTLGLLANLTAGEICEQVWHARNLCGKTGVRNVVMMGMGEPLDNYEEVLIALRAMTHQAVFDMRQRSVTVSTILERFESDSRAKARSPEQAEMAGEITSGLRAYFDRSLRAVLLYTQEHAQADELLTGGKKAPCDVYGGEHLLRLFVKLPELVPLGDMDQDATHLLHMRLQDFLRWLQRNAASSFGCGYVSVKDGKTVLEPERTKEYVAPQEKKGSSPETTKRSVEPEPVAT